MGTTTRLIIETIMSTKGIGISRPAKIFIASGVIRGAIRVEQAVMVTERATLPRARYTMTFDATPPEHEPIKITPAATSGSNPNALATPHPAKGMTVNCRNIPIRTALGILNAREIREAKTRAHAEHNELDQRDVETGKLESSPTEKSRRVE